MSRAMVSLSNARITSDPKPDWAQNGARMLRFSVMVTVFRGERKNALFYQVSLYGKIAEAWVDKVEKGLVKKGTIVNATCRVESHQVYTDKEGVQQVAINVTALDIEPTFAWMKQAEDKPITADRKEFTYG